ncbi:MAG: tripartite tricarboxylate transporter substrate-binding protein [Vicinamibacterales bacterium]
MTRHSVVLGLSLAIALHAASARSSVHAQGGRLTIVAPAAPGGGWDQTSRTLQQALQASGLSPGAKVVNVPGAGGTIGLAQFVNNNRGRDDVLLTMGLIMVGAVLTNKSPVTLAQVTPIARLSGEYEVLVVPEASPLKSLGEFVSAWKANPGKLAIAGGSAGGTDHMMAGLLAKLVGIDPTKINYVPHSGGGEAAASLIGNQVSAGINGLNELQAFIKAGKLRALALSSEKRLAGAAIPTFVEQGVDFTLANWRGIVAPPGITSQQRASMTALLDKLHASPAWKEALARNNWTDLYQSGPAFDAFLKEEDARASAVLRSIGLVK